MIKCICFDLDNTLFPEASYYKECYQEIARLFFLGEEGQIVKKMIEIRHQERDYLVFQKIIESYHLDQTFLHYFVDIYRTHQANISLFPDAENFLNFKNPSLKYGLLTNGSEKTQKNKLKCLGLEESFDFIFVTGEFLPRDEWKPNKKAFELIPEHTKIKFSECLFVGDLVEKDILGALNVGMHAVLIDRAAVLEKPEFRHQSYWVIHTFEQIHQVVNEIEGQI